ncbi:MULTISPECIES: amino acid ABC transporter permease [unclassified Variovorax]|jgi:His/Glu/Gln/Arg/opine family amino acid ABC transporter permease subunit|uniref:amino acid ABC transporter permease n=1 Tax=unclassified Variovorax TaxID=663243 RepID=UPI002B232986|nr:MULTISPECIES: amino acid ABC transporter permease [unclassified Variovorax]MEB0058259.1 amino acid ABC transporter permease [Variovorax sp. LG9.2]MEB0111934.1 amino acid ABC transporter permease [Variovorax sp. RTB1]
MIAFFAAYAEQWADWGPRLRAAAQVTAGLSLGGFVLAALLGALLTLALRSSSASLRRIASAYVQFIRAVPLLALLLAIYFVLPQAGLTLSGFWAGVFGLGLQGSAYVAEILRGGIASVHKGQTEAGLTVGMSPWQVFLNVTAPQALRVMMPPLLNAYVSLLKDSSLCALIATDELMLTARAISSESFLPLHIFLLAGVFYFAIAFPLSMLSRWLEARLARGRRVMGT